MKVKILHTYSGLNGSRIYTECSECVWSWLTLSYSQSSGINKNTLIAWKNPNILKDGKEGIGRHEKEVFKKRKKWKMFQHKK